MSHLVGGYSLFTEIRVRYKPHDKKYVVLSLYMCGVRAGVYYENIITIKGRIWRPDHITINFLQKGIYKNVCRYVRLSKL